jgi:hypothetical protein
MSLFIVKVNIKYLNNKVKAKIKNKAILDFTR